MADTNRALAEIFADYVELLEYLAVPLTDANSPSAFGNYPLNIAATRGALGDLTTLLAHGAKIDALGEHGYTALHDAVEQSQGAAVRLLLAHGAQSHICNESGDTPLQLAELLGDPAMVEVLSDVSPPASPT